MKTQKMVFLGAFAVALAASAAVTGPAGELAIGSRAPMTEVEMVDVSGDVHTLGALAGERGLLVIFTCNTCPWVAAWEDRYPVLAAQAEALGVGMVLLNPNAALRAGAESLEAMRQRAREQGYPVPYLVDADAKVARAFGATRTPHVFLFDGDLALVYRGAIDDNARQPERVERHYLADAMDALASGRPIEPQETRSLGCGIKFPD